MFGYSAGQAWTHQCIHREIRTPFTCPSRNLSSGYSSSKAWIHPRIHCRYSIRTDQYLACLDILLVKHGLTNAFTEKSEHPSHAHLEICHQDILAAKHGLTNAYTVDIPTEPIHASCICIILLLKHGLTTARSPLSVRGRCICRLRSGFPPYPNVHCRTLLLATIRLC